MSSVVTSAAGKKYVIALGSNLMNRLQNINSALVALNTRVGTVQVTSSLYETAPQYVEDQPAFLNAACVVHTELNPTEVLRELKEVEKDIGRVPSVRFGPRLIDLDILLCGDEVVDVDSPEGGLIVPHPRIMERAFVLAPLCDIISTDAVHPSPTMGPDWASRNFHEQYSHLIDSSSADIPKRVISPGPDIFWGLGSRTFVMGILNVTPDSFSDGGELCSVPALISRATEMVEAGCDILDVGGESTKPSSDAISESEELERVVPAIKALRAAGMDVPISVDTTRACVARAAIMAGANAINDISGGLFDEAMLSTAAELDVPIVLMDSRGSRETMHVKHPSEDVVVAIAQRLCQRIKAADAAGIPRWNVIVDPGIGFGRTQAQNLTILEKLQQIQEGVNCPMLIGASRKTFVRELSGMGGREPNAAVIGSVVAACAGVVGGADIVRVHDVPETLQAVRMADAVWRGS